MTHWQVNISGMPSKCLALILLRNDSSLSRLTHALQPKGTDRGGYGQKMGNVGRCHKPYVVSRVSHGLLQCIKTTALRWHCFCIFYRMRWEVQGQEWMTAEGSPAGPVFADLRVKGKSHPWWMWGSFGEPFPGSISILEMSLRQAEGMSIAQALAMTVAEIPVFLYSTFGQVKPNMCMHIQC